MPLNSRVRLSLCLVVLAFLPKIAFCDDIRQVNVAVDGLLYNPTDGKLYGGVVGGTSTGSIVPLDPETATLGAPTPLGGTPQEMVLNSDGHSIDAVLSGGNQIRRFDTTSQTLGIQYGLGHDYSDLYAEDIAALPGSPGSIVVSRANSGISPRHKDIVIFDNGVLRFNPNRVAGANYIEVNESGTRLYGYLAEISSFDFVGWDIGSSGFSNGNSIHPISGNLNFKYAGGRAYTSNGTIFDPENGLKFGNFASQSLGMTVPDVASNKLFTASQNGSSVTIQVQNLKTLTPLGSIVVPGVSGTPGRLLRWGSNGLAFRTGSQVFLVRSSLVETLPPTVTGVNPVQARVGGAVVITGKDLLPTSSVQFNGVEALFQINSDTQITAVVPIGATNGPIRVSTAGGSAETQPFTVLMPTISIGDASISEGNDGTANLDFTVRLSYATNDTVSFDFTTADGTAVAGTDYTATSGTRSFVPGQTSLTISVPVQGETTFETEENFTVRLSNVVGAITATPAPLLRNTGNGHFYEMVLANLDWDGARAAAAARNYWGVAGHLVTITSAEEEAFVSTNFGGVTFWLGAVQAPGSTEPAGGFGWVTGEPFDYTDWNSGEPNNVGGNEDVVQRNNFNRWNDVPRASTASRYLVEYDVAADTTGPDTEAVGTILNDDSVPTLSIGGVQISEGDSGNSNADFSVSLSNPSSLPITVDYATTDDTATADLDYTSTSGTLTFAPGETTQTISVSVIGDVVDEEDETFNLALSSPKDATLGTSTAVGTITDDDTSEISVDNSTLNEGNVGNFPLNFTIKLTKPSSRTVKVTYQTPDANHPAPEDEATSGVDYLAVPPTTVTFMPGQTSRVVAVRVKGDTQREANERFTLFVAGTQNVAGTTQGTGTILNDDGVPMVSINDVSVKEGAGGSATTATFTIKLSRVTFEPVTVNYTTSSGGDFGTALPNKDYTSTAGVLTFAPGETSKSLGVAITNDNIDEDNETFSLVLSEPSNAALLKAKGKVTIVDDDSAPSISFAPTPASINERNTGTNQLSFNIRLSAPSSRPIQVTYQTANASTNPATTGTDYEAVSPTVVTIPAGATTARLIVIVKGDVAYELDERIGLILSRPVNATIASGQNKAEGTILNDDKMPTARINNVAIAEGNSGTKTLIFTARLSVPSGFPASVKYATVNSTALAGSDYASIAGTLNFAPGETSKTIAVTIKGDTLPEADEQFQLVLSSPVGAILNDETATGTGTIRNDDRATRDNPSAGSG